MTATHIKYLKSLEACPSAIKFASAYSSLSDAYAACTRPDWLFWLAGHTGVSRRDIVLAACACARTALPFATGPEALFAIETAEAWCRGEATAEQVRTAAIASAANAADGDNAADAAVYAAAAAYATYAAAADYDPSVAGCDGDFDAKVTMCDLIRAIIPCPKVVR
jgi:hypothetical protein